MLLKQDIMNILIQLRKYQTFIKININLIFYEIDGSLQIEEITEKIKQILKKS